ncbi:MAG: hypothetical protein JW709_00010 [Sedimentisphaerales bacterium]|nr:hypothetical protein [Sedimentisphaerales bacterium]
MSSIPPHIIGTFFQAQAASTETSKSADTERNKRARDSRQLARMTDQQEHEVETTDSVELRRLEAQDERPRDTHREQYYDLASEIDDESNPTPAPPPDSSKNPDNPPSDPAGHIDISA